MTTTTLEVPATGRPQLDHKAGGLGGMAFGLVLLGALRDAAKNQDARTVGQTENALNANGATAHRLARELGMKVCSTGG